MIGSLLAAKLISGQREYVSLRSKRVCPLLSQTGPLGVRLLGTAKGQGLAEYIIIVVIVALVIFLGVRYFGGTLSGQFENATEEVSGLQDGGAVKDSGEGKGSSSQKSESAYVDSGGEDVQYDSSGKKGTKSVRGTGTADLEELRASGVGEAASDTLENLELDWQTLTFMGVLVCAIGVFLVLRITKQKGPKKKKKKKKKKLGSKQSGQVLVIGLFVAVGLFMVAITVANVGVMVAEKIHLQDTVDAAAYSAAVVEARYLNLSAYVNRAMIANYNAMAFNTALWATVDAYDHGMAMVVGALYMIAAVIQLIPFLQAVGIALDEIAYVIDITVHNLFHLMNAEVTNPAFDQTETDVNKYIEIYNTDILSTYQGLLYAALQSSRYAVGKEVARQMDPDVLTTSYLGLGAEAVSSDSLKGAVDWVVEDTDEREAPFDTINSTFNTVFGAENDDDNHPVLLGALTEVSLDKFSAGRDRSGITNLIRSFNFGEILPGFVEDVIEVFLTAECVAECVVTLGFGDCDCDKEVSLILGSQAIYGREDDFDQDRVPRIARQRMHEVNFFGLDVDMDSLFDSSGLGHTSGEYHADIANKANLMALDSIGSDRWFECLFNSFQCNLNDINDSMSRGMLFGVGGTIASICGLVDDLSFFDDHWDGAADPQVACGVRYINFGAQMCYGDVAEYIEEVCSNGFEEGVPKYDFRTDLNNVGFANYYFDDTGAQERPDGTSGGDEENKLSGPSIGMVGIKQKSAIQGMQGLGIGNSYSMSALARAQVYYLRNPNRPKERPNLFNPYWVPRLAPLDSEDTPALLKEGLPFLMSHGIPIAPTH